MNVGAILEIQHLAESYMAATPVNQMAPNRPHKKDRKPRPPPKPKARSLVDEIPRCTVSSYFDADEEFVPNGVIDELITREVLDTHFNLDKGLGSDQEIDPEEKQEVIDYIMNNGAKKLFLIAVHTGLEGFDLLQVMIKFIDNEMDDNSLPVIRDEEVRKMKARDGRTFSSRMGLGATDFDAKLHSQGHESKLTEIDPDEHYWTSGRRADFYQKQWKFLAPTFSTSQDSYDFNRKMILPFTHKGNDSRVGGFGQVFRVAIHPEHIEDPSKLVGHPLCPR
jgi:hypothetical protein